MPIFYDQLSIRRNNFDYLNHTYIYHFWRKNVLLVIMTSWQYWYTVNAFYLVQLYDF